jgi:hypothetical protein
VTSEIEIEITIERWEDGRQTIGGWEESRLTWWRRSEQLQLSGASGGSKTEKERNVHLGSEAHDCSPWRLGSSIDKVMFG